MAPVPPLAIGNVPVTPVVSGNPVRLVATPETGVPKAGVTNVLLDNVSAPSRVAKVPAVGRVNEVAAVDLNVVAYAPDVARLPPSVIDFPVLSTPVPPLAAGKIEVTPVARFTALTAVVSQVAIPLVCVVSTFPSVPLRLG